MKLPKYITKDKDDEFILTDRTGKKWNLGTLFCIVEEFKEWESNEAIKKEDEVCYDETLIRKRLELARGIIK
jgi:hypothetical protein